MGTKVDELYFTNCDREKKGLYNILFVAIVKHYVTVCRFKAGRQAGREDDDGTHHRVYSKKKYIMNGGQTMNNNNSNIYIYKR